MSIKNPSRTAHLYVFASTVLCGGVVALLGSVVLFPPVFDIRLLLIMTGAVLSESFRLYLSVYSWSLTYPLSMSAAVLGGPGAACLVSLASAVTIQDLREKTPVHIMIFNTGQLLLSSAAGGFAYVFAGGRILLSTSGVYLPLQLSDFPATLIAMAAAALASFGVNLLLTSAGMHVFRGAPFRSVLIASMALVPSQIALAFIGFLMAEVLAIAAIALPLFIFPLIVARELYQRYEALRDAYRDTIRSLVGALEAKDSYTRGHSVRVAEYAAQIGKELGLDETQLENLEYAALLHDLGKLSLPSTILTKPSVLTTSEMESMRNHPIAGSEMVERIPPLRGLAKPIGAHHEWFDGNGYPRNIAGTDIPLLARILSVADAYDAMTTNRSYRPALSEQRAVQEIEAGKGTQFDPVVVGAFLGTRKINAVDDDQNGRINE